MTNKEENNSPQNLSSDQIDPTEEETPSQLGLSQLQLRFRGQPNGPQFSGFHFKAHPEMEDRAGWVGRVQVPDPNPLKRVMGRNPSRFSHRFLMWNVAVCDSGQRRSTGTRRPPLHFVGRRVETPTHDSTTLGTRELLRLVLRTPPSPCH